jgi:hypothetical protein
MNCKHCGEIMLQDRPVASAPAVYVYCDGCLENIVMEWEAAQDEPIPFEVEKKAVVA